MRWDKMTPWLWAHDVEIFLWTFLVLVFNGLLNY